MVGYIGIIIGGLFLLTSLARLYYAVIGVYILFLMLMLGVLHACAILAETVHATKAYCLEEIRAYRTGGRA